MQLERELLGGLAPKDAVAPVRLPYKYYGGGIRYLRRRVYFGSRESKSAYVRRATESPKTH